MTTETRYIVKVRHYNPGKTMSRIYYWKSEGRGVTPIREGAYEYTAEQLKNHSKAYTIKQNKQVVLVPVQVKKD